MSAGDFTDLVKLPNLGLGPLLEKKILNPRKGCNLIFFKNGVLKLGRKRISLDLQFITYLIVVCFSGSAVGSELGSGDGSGLGVGALVVVGAGVVLYSTQSSPFQVQ